MGLRHTLAAMFFLAFVSLVSAQTNPAPPAPGQNAPARGAASPAAAGQNAPVPAHNAPAAEDTAPGDASGDLFSLSALIDAALSGDLLWYPDWPLAIPPDSFIPARQTNQGVSITLTLGTPQAADQGAGDAQVTEGDAVQPTSLRSRTEGTHAVPVEFWYTKEPGSQVSRGRLINFPYFINGVFCQVQAFFTGQNGTLASMRVLGEGDPWEIEFTRFNAGLPLMGRVSRGGSYSFVVFQYLDRETTETWYDEGGGALGFFSLKYRDLNGRRRLVSMENRSDETVVVTAYDYDSAGNISGISAPEGSYAALYTAEGRLRYWEKPGASYTLQWDEKGFLVSLSGTVLVVPPPGGTEEAPESASPAGTGETPASESASPAREEVNIRYEYTGGAIDWTERQELPLIRRFGVLVPGPGLPVRRTVEYGAGR
jgi:YD repeat-containing protein